MPASLPALMIGGALAALLMAHPALARGLEPLGPPEAAWDAGDTAGTIAMTLGTTLVGGFTGALIGGSLGGSDAGYFLGAMDGVAIGAFIGASSGPLLYDASGGLRGSGSLAVLGAGLGAGGGALLAYRTRSPLLLFFTAPLGAAVGAISLYGISAAQYEPGGLTLSPIPGGLVLSGTF